MLLINDIHTYYGKSHILMGVSFEIHGGELVSLLGRNGAGKTISLRSIMGLTPPGSGTILFNSVPISGKKPFEICRMGVGYVPEERAVFSLLTVKENLDIAIKRGGTGKWDIHKICEVFPILQKRFKHKGSQLSGGEQQMLSIARALMGNPSLLLLDEPTEGLAPMIIERLMAVIRRIKSEETTILLVEQNVGSTQDMADHYYVLEEGKIIFHTTRKDFEKEEKVLNNYLRV